MHCAGFRGLAIHQHVLGTCRIGGQRFHFVQPVIGDARMHDIAVSGEFDGRLQDLGETFRAVILKQFGPGGNRARDRHRVRAMQRDLVLQTKRVQFGEGGGGRRLAGAVQGDRLAGALRSVERETVAADTGHGRLDHTHNGTGRDGRVDRVAAGFQDGKACLRGQGMAGGNRRSAGKNGGTSGELEISHCFGSIRSEQAHSCAGRRQSVQEPAWTPERGLP